MRRFRTAAAALLLASGLATAAFAQVKLELKHPAGKSTTTSTMKVNQTISVMGIEIPTSSDTSTVETAVTSPPDADGNFRVEQKTEAVKVHVKQGPVGLEFDSAKPEAAKVDNAALQPVVDMYKALTGAAYTVVLDKDSKVKSVEGLDKIVTQAGTAGELVRSVLNADRIQKEIAEGYARLPENSVKPGDKWQRVETMDVGAGQVFTFTAYYEYQGTVEKAGKTLDKIIFNVGDVKLAIDPNSPLPAKVTNSDLKIESSTGLLLMDRATGTFVEQTSSVRIVGPMTLTTNNMDLPAKLDLTMERSSIITR